jgi:hypothetical protein
MKALQLIAWIAGAIALILVVLGTIDYIFNIRILGVNHVINVFHIANSFALLAIVSLLLKKTLKE